MLYASQHAIRVTLHTVPMWFDFRFLFYMEFFYQLHVIILKDDGSCDHTHHFLVLCSTESVLPCICTLTLTQETFIESS